MVGLVILILSIALLIWGLLPPRREIRTQPISPTELQLPTPETLHSDFVIETSGIAYGLSHIAIRDPRHLHWHQVQV